MRIISQPISYRDGNTELTGYLFLDESRNSQRPGIMVVHGGAGLDDHAKGRALRLAEMGYVAFAGDMYGEGVAAAGRARIMPFIMELCAEPARLRQRACAGLDVLAAHPQVDSRRIAAIGYCFGGMTVLELARGGEDLAGVVSVHGGLQPAQLVAQNHAPEDVPIPSGSEEPKRVSIRPRILVCHGAQDPHVPMPQVTAFMEEMTAASADWQLNIYANALHGFTHETPSSAPGVAYNAQADARSGKAISAFLADLFGVR